MEKQVKLFLEFFTNKHPAVAAVFESEFTSLFIIFRIANG